MKKFLASVLVFFSFLAIHFTIPRSTKAQETNFNCEILSLTPSDNSGLNFDFEARACSGSDAIGRAFSVRYFDTNGTEFDFDAQNQGVPGPGGRITASVGFVQNGSYEVFLAMHDGANTFSDYTIIGTVTVEITSGEDPDVPVEDIMLGCGSPCSEGSTCNNCPSFCEAVGQDQLGIWTCGGVSPLCPNNTYGVAGIDTAIGCLPIESHTTTSLFLLQYSVGIGGGISLLILAIGSYRVMVSRGSPDTLQSGRELITAAIGGIALLIFSAIIVRFILFEVLQIV